MATIAEQITQIIVDKLGCEESQVVPSASFTADLGADSLDIVELVMELENSFNTSISDDKAEQIQTVGDAIKFIEELQKA